MGTIFVRKCFSGWIYLCQIQNTDITSYPAEVRQYINTHKILFERLKQFITDAKADTAEKKSLNGAVASNHGYL